MAKMVALFFPGVYGVGVLTGLAFDFWRYWTVGGQDGFPFLESLTYASLWPLRLY